MDRNNNYDNIKIIICNEVRENIDIINYIINEEKLINMVKPAINLSNVEKFIYTYNVVKKFKPYNQSNNNWEDSRALYDILNNDYMVCAGYVRLLKDLLEKLGIQSQHYGVKVLGEDGLYYNHALLQVRLKDTKYNVNGIYLSDPTNDSDFEYDYYTFALMTSSENIYSIPDSGELHFENFYHINSLEEFFDHCTNWIKNNNKRSYYNLIKLLLDSIKCIDIKKYDYLMETYSKIIKNNNLNRETINKILSDIGCYILDRSNNPINDDVINSAIKIIYQKFYNFDNVKELSNQLNKTIVENEKRKSEFQRDEKSL